MNCVGADDDQLMIDFGEVGAGAESCAAGELGAEAVDVAGVCSEL